MPCPTPGPPLHHTAREGRGRKNLAGGGVQRKSGRPFQSGAWSLWLIKAAAPLGQPREPLLASNRRERASW